MPGTPSDCPGSMNLSMLCTEPNYSVHVIWQADSIRLLWILIISTKQTSQPHFACMNILGCHLRSATHRRHFNASCSRRCCFFLILLTYLDDVIYSETIDEHHEWLDFVLTRLQERGLKLSPKTLLWSVRNEVKGKKGCYYNRFELKSEESSLNFFFVNEYKKKIEKR